MLHDISQEAMKTDYYMLESDVEASNRPLAFALIAGNDYVEWPTTGSATVLKLANGCGLQLKVMVNLIGCILRGRHDNICDTYILFSLTMTTMRFRHLLV